VSDDIHIHLIVQRLGDIDSILDVSMTVQCRKYVAIKGQLEAKYWFLL